MSNSDFLAGQPLYESTLARASHAHYSDEYVIELRHDMNAVLSFKVVCGDL